MQALTVSTSNATNIDQLTWQDIPLPTLQPDEVLIAVQAGGLNPVDYKIVENGHLNWPIPHVLGLDVAGTITKIGAQVHHLHIGQRVAGHGNLATNGCFAEYVAFKAAALAPIPDNLDFATAAGSLCAGLTAYQSLFRKANLSNVHSVLIHGGAGGVGSMAIQLAKNQGKTVYTTVSSAKQSFAAQLAPDAMIDYHHENVSARISNLTHQKGVDLIINTTGNADADLERLAFNGQLVCLLDPPLKIQSQLGHSVACVNLGGAHRSNNIDQLRDLGSMTTELLDLVAHHQVDPLITQKITFHNIPLGLQQIKRHQIMGKIVAVKSLAQ